MNFSGNHFVYNGINSQRYNLRILHLDTQPITQASGTPEYNKIFYNNEKKNSIVGMNWGNSPISTEIEFLSEKPLKKQDKREVEKWLFNNSQFQKLYIDIREDEEIEIINGEKKQCYIECVFYEPTVIEYYGGIVGFKAKMDMSCPFAFQDEITVKFDNENLDNIFININNDLNEYIYPKITIKINQTSSTEKITIQNDSVVYQEYSYDSQKEQIIEKDITNSMEISNADKGDTLYINTLLSTIECKNSDKGLYNWFNKLANASFLKLKQGDNLIKFTNGNNRIESIEFTYQQMRYIR